MWNVQDYRFATNPAEAVALMRKGPGKGAYIAGGHGYAAGSSGLRFCRRRQQLRDRGHRPHSRRRSVSGRRGYPANTW